MGLVTAVSRMACAVAVLNVPMALTQARYTLSKHIEGSVSGIRNMHAQWASRQVYASPMRPAQLCVCMSINDIPDCDGHVHTHIMRIDPSFRASR